MTKRLIYFATLLLAILAASCEALPKVPGIPVYVGFWKMTYVVAPGYQEFAGDLMKELASRGFVIVEKRSQSRIWLLLVPPDLGYQEATSASREVEIVAVLRVRITYAEEIRLAGKSRRWAVTTMADRITKVALANLDAVKMNPSETLW